MRLVPRSPLTATTPSKAPGAVARDAGWVELDALSVDDCQTCQRTGLGSSSTLATINILCRHRACFSRRCWCYLRRRRARVGHRTVSLRRPAICDHNLLHPIETVRKDFLIVRAQDDLPKLEVGPPSELDEDISATDRPSISQAEHRVRVQTPGAQGIGNVLGMLVRCVPFGAERFLGRELKVRPTENL